VQGPNGRWHLVKEQLVASYVAALEDGLNAVIVSHFSRATILAPITLRAPLEFRDRPEFVIASVDYDDDRILALSFKCDALLGNAASLEGTVNLNPFTTLVETSGDDWGLWEGRLTMTERHEGCEGRCAEQANGQLNRSANCAAQVSDTHLPTSNPHDTVDHSPILPDTGIDIDVPGDGHLTGPYEYNHDIAGNSTYSATSGTLEGDSDSSDQDWFIWRTQSFLDAGDGKMATDGVARRPSPLNPGPLGQDEAPASSRFVAAVTVSVRSPSPNTPSSDSLVSPDKVSRRLSGSPMQGLRSKRPDESLSRQHATEIHRAALSHMQFAAGRSFPSLCRPRPIGILVRISALHVSASGTLTLVFPSRDSLVDSAVGTIIGGADRPTRIGSEEAEAKICLNPDPIRTLELSVSPDNWLTRWLVSRSEARLLSRICDCVRNLTFHVPLAANGDGGGGTEI